jgi:Phage integrase, N-terminal SAM-like domain
MTPRRRRMREDVQRRGLAPKTHPCSVAAVHQLAPHDQRPPAQRRAEALRPYFWCLLQEKTVAESPVRIQRSGIKCLSEMTLQRPWPVCALVRPRQRQQRPVGFRGQEVRPLLPVGEHATARRCLRRISACGLRLTAGIRRQGAAMDPQRRLGRVRQGHGGTDRRVPLAPRVRA